MSFTDWLNDGMNWWGTQMWYFMKNFPPYDWVEPPLYYFKVFSFIFPILIIILLPYILWFRSSQKNRKLQDQIASISRGSYTHGFSCPHCNYIPSHYPVGNSYYCAKCGQFTKVSSKNRTSFSFHI